MSSSRMHAAQTVPPPPTTTSTVLTAPLGWSWTNRTREPAGRVTSSYSASPSLPAHPRHCRPLPATASRQKQEQRATTVSRPADPGPCRKCRLSTPPEPGPSGVPQSPRVMLLVGVAEMTSTWSPPAPSLHEVTLSYALGICNVRGLRR